jgi:hypothetical protein
MSIVFFTIVDDRYYHAVGTEILINSFKKFHPEIDLVIFRQDMINKVFAEKKVNFYNCKPTFAKILVPHYDKVVNIDADTIILGRLDKIIDSDWEVGAVWNKNDYEDATVDNVTKDMYVQAGMVGSSNPMFWDIWEIENKNALKLLRQENDVLNQIWYNNPIVKKMDRVIWDKDKDYMGCKSLGREGEFYINDGKIMCRKQQVLAYHSAKGGANMPKFQFERMGFGDKVRQYMEYLGYFGSSVRLGGT